MGPSERTLEQTQQLIVRTARRLKRKPEFRAFDAEDIEQEIRLHLVAKWRYFDPRRGSELALALTIIPRAAASLVRRQRAQCRDDRDNINLSAVSESVEPVAPDGHVDRVDQCLDLEWLLDHLDEPLRELCQRLATEGPTAISKQTGMARSSIYRCAARIRTQAEEGGMEC